jgi:hypothetical protein
MDWELTIKLYWPHNRFMLGWEYVGSDDVYHYTTIKLHLFILSIEIDF